MNHRSIVLLIGLCSLLLLGGGRQRGEREELTTLLEAIKEYYRVDDRLSVYDVRWKFDGDILVLSGEVDRKEYKQKLLDTLKALKYDRVLDNIEVLPSPTLGDMHYGVVLVSVADVRRAPDNRKEMVTQALMGTPVILLSEGKQFWRVRLPDGYIGWMKRSAFVRMSKRELERWEQGPRGIVVEYFSVIRSQPSDSSRPVSDVVLGCIVKLGDTTNGWITVERADGSRGYLRESTVQKYNEWKESRVLTAESLEHTAMQFYGFPYLWGGTSVKGFDCSGFVQTVFALNGYALPRDADMQATCGMHVDPGKRFENVKKGDLLFFGEKATQRKNEHVTHVALSLDSATFIHCAGYVRLGSFNPQSKYYDETLKKTFLRARRILQH